MATTGTQDVVWSFGYGSNMDVKSLESKKHVKIVDHVAAVLPGWRLAFSLAGLPRAEPAYANIARGSPGDEVHGVAFCMTRESGEELDRTESGYNKMEVTLHAYDGRELAGFVYVSKKGDSQTKEIAPSSRYLGVLVRGARRAGLKEDYVTRLAARETYTPTTETLAMRAALPAPETLKQIPVSELADHGAQSADPWVAGLGYVMKKPGSYFGSHAGRDITTRMLNQFYAIPMDDNDDKGRPPYPILKDLDPAAVEYAETWRDHWLGNVNGEVIGYVKEFLEQQKSGKSTWKLPQEPQLD